MYGIDHGIGVGMGWGGFGMILVWLLPILLIVLLARAFIGRSGSGSQTDERPRKTALEELDERYASGAVKREDYLKQRADLAH